MPLKVIVVGAGLGGLVAAIALAREGHDVEIFEKSAFSNEVGAAIHLAPNASRILRTWGIDLNKASPSQCTCIAIWSKEGKYLKELVSKNLQAEMGTEDDWFQVHRVDLHKMLRSHATESALGRRVNLSLSCPVLSVDVDLGKVHLEDGRDFQADLVVGADGLHSKTVNAMCQEPPLKISTGQMCYRFLVPVEKAEREPEIGNLLGKLGLQSANVFSSEERRLVMYPCRSGELLNIAGIVPEHQGQGGAQAFEDAAALGALFTADTRIEDIDQRLKMYNKIRYQHAVTVMFMSRVADDKRQQVLEDLKRFVPNATCPTDMAQLTWRSDPIKTAKEELGLLV
ncbi:hypothetical protein E8E13_002324 [Curvularia kusanoi]|uniref:FAD-binding domain-containing protein n=1 Tax=Curvularia kusanoi TaxID=90978 RepID=A0A9P4T4I3_CURKU|nr:hypothetical protein E8E13_002324 [Curvularia kusanoi]